LWSEHSASAHSLHLGEQQKLVFQPRFVPAMPFLSLLVVLLGLSVQTNILQEDVAATLGEHLGYNLCT
jgi:hypothetical protein